MTLHTVKDIAILQKTKVMQVSFENGKQFSYPFEYLRVFTPSAEAKGHGTTPIQWPKQKQAVMVVSAEPVGLYAIRLIFDDGHQSGLFSWDYLYELGEHADENWRQYQAACQDAS